MGSVLENATEQHEWQYASPEKCKWGGEEQNVYSKGQRVSSGTEVGTDYSGLGLYDIETRLAIDGLQ